MRQIVSSWTLVGERVELGRSGCLWESECTLWKVHGAVELLADGSDPLRVHETGRKRCIQTCAVGGPLHDDSACINE